MDNQQVFFYTYICIGECGRYYIGAHATSNLDDNYMGSYKDATFKPIKKIIIKFFQDYQGATSYEYFLLKYHNIKKNDKFVNTHVTPPIHPTYGKGHTESTKQKISKTKREKKSGVGENNPAYGKVVKYNILLGKNELVPKSDIYPEYLIGLKHSEETKTKMSKAQITDWKISL